MELKDKLGRRLEVGQVIAYPGRSGSSLWVSLAVITKIETRPFGYGSNTEPVLRVFGVSENWQNHLSTYRGSVTSIDRTMVIHPEYYDDKITWLLAEYAKTQPSGGSP